MASNDEVAVVGLGCLVVVLIIAMVAFNAWIIMLVWGGLAAAFGFSTISYGTSILVALALSIVGSFFRSTVAK